MIMLYEEKTRCAYAAVRTNAEGWKHNRLWFARLGHTTLGGEEINDFRMDAAVL